MRTIILAILLLGSPVSAEAANYDACMVKNAVWVTLRLENLVPIAPVRLNDLGIEAIIDTGAQGAALSASEAADYGLRYIRTMAVTSSHGTQSTTPLAVGDVDIGGLRFRDRLIAPADAATFGGRLLLGAGSFSGYGLYLGFSENVMGLMNMGACPGYVPFDAPYGHVGMDTSGATPHIQATVNGHPVSAMVDTGANISLMGLAAARAAGITNEMLAAGRPVQGHVFGDKAVSGWMVPVRIGFGGLQAGAHVVVQPLETDELVLGMNVLSHFDLVFDPYGQQILFKAR